MKFLNRFSLKTIYAYLYIVYNSRFIGLKKSYQILKAYSLIKQNNLFDAGEYLKKNKDLQKKNINPLIHYIYFGWKENRKINKINIIENYLSSNKEFKKSKLNPLIFIIMHGKKKFMLPNYNNLKLTLKGKNKYLFLINDSNNEIKQHFDDFYQNNFDSQKFKNHVLLKKEILNNSEIKYFFFIIPDKSLVCHEYLPFKFNKIKRNYDKVKEIFPDFINYLTPKDYFKYDTHINYSGGKKLSFKYLNYINNDFKEKYFNKLIDETIDPYPIKRFFDLLLDSNWSYSDKEKSKYTPSKIVYTIKPHYLTDKTEEIPDEFKKCRERKSTYLKNTKSFSNLKVLIFGDSFTRYLKNYLILYFKEFFCYWDHGKMNKELIEWYKPDIILEIRSERFLEYYVYTDWISNDIRLNMD